MVHQMKIKRVRINLKFFISEICIDSNKQFNVDKTIPKYNQCFFDICKMRRKLGKRVFIEVTVKKTWCLSAILLISLVPKSVSINISTFVLLAMQISKPLFLYSWLLYGAAFLDVLIIVCTFVWVHAVKLFIITTKGPVRTTKIDCVDPCTERKAINLLLLNELKKGHKCTWTNNSVWLYKLYCGLFFLIISNIKKNSLYYFCDTYVHIYFYNAINGQCCACECEERSCNGRCNSKSSNRSCCCDSRADPIEKSCIRHVIDSWAFIVFKYFNPRMLNLFFFFFFFLLLFMLCAKFFLKKKKKERCVEAEVANETGALAVSSWLKYLQLFFRDLVLGILMMLYIPVFGYFNGWFVFFAGAVLIRWAIMWKRSRIPRSSVPFPQSFFVFVFCFLRLFLSLKGIVL
ncbi:hypothetical protein RFI_06208 [Reticulomyxa filosa]|uniref:Uncharacterized protein n=1 Tax=Reticulomyxa filosa TaxID=46433 RepID=X6NY76_RETFI|nr:hypothetical protein RFI_06208 [Reticulomyxa filosa]|eukprot:ETO30911.1 hypothetical protein RFI_06208 [Reticulomyxa filosa]